jgi:hypothetical protein
MGGKVSSHKVLVTGKLIRMNKSLCLHIFVKMLVKINNY